MPVRNALDLHWCAGCEGVRAFEPPPCDDGHDPGSCPERACVDCGDAVLLGHLAGGFPASSGARVPEEELLFSRAADLESDLTASTRSRTARTSWSSRRTA